MKYVALYDIAPDGMSKVMTHFPAHRARAGDCRGTAWQSPGRRHGNLLHPRSRGGIRKGRSIRGKWCRVEMANRGVGCSLHMRGAA